MSYLTVVVPFVAKNATKWHPTTNVGPFATLTRGKFDTKEAADKWAADNLDGHPYRLLECDGGE